MPIDVTITIPDPAIPHIQAAKARVEIVFGPMTLKQFLAHIVRGAVVEILQNDIRSTKQTEADASVATVVNQIGGIS